MQLNLSVFKKGTVYWVIGGIILFAGFFYLASKGGWGGSEETSGGTTVVSSGPSEAAQLSMAQLSAQSNMFQAQISSDTAIAQLGSQTQIALATLQAGLMNKETELGYNAALAGMANDKAIAQMNFEYSIDSARVAAENNESLANIQRLAQKDFIDSQSAILTTQMQTNAQMFKAQLDASNYQSLIGAVGTLKKKNRDETLQIIAGGNSFVNTPTGTTVWGGGPAIAYLPSPSTQG